MDRYNSNAHSTWHLKKNILLTFSRKPTCFFSFEKNSQPRGPERLFVLEPYKNLYFKFHCIMSRELFEIPIYFMNSFAMRVRSQVTLYIRMCRSRLLFLEVAICWWYLSFRKNSHLCDS